MKSLLTGATLAFVVALPAPGIAQNAPLVVGAPAAAGDMLRAGTEVQLRTTQPLSSNDSRVGDRFTLEVAQDVRLGGRTVIPIGTRAYGEVTRADKKGMFGKSGKLDTRLLYIDLNGQQVRLSGKAGEKGSGGTAGAVGASLLFLPAGLFVTGKSAVLPPGTQTVGALESDLPVTFAR